LYQWTTALRFHTEAVEAGFERRKKCQHEIVQQRGHLDLWFMDQKESALHVVARAALTGGGRLTAIFWILARMLAVG
jgi:hypothetical protein